MEALRCLAIAIRQSVTKLKEQMPQSTEGLLLLPSLRRKSLKRATARRLAKEAKRVKQKAKSEQTGSEIPPQKKRKTSHSKRVGIKADRMRHENSTMKDRQGQKRKLTNAVNPHTRETEARISCNASIDFNQNAANVDFQCNSESLLPVTPTLCEPTFQSKVEAVLTF